LSGTERGNNDEDQPIRTVAYNLIGGESINRMTRTHEVGQVMIIDHLHSRALPRGARHEAQWYE